MLLKAALGHGTGKNIMRGTLSDIVNEMEENYKGMIRFYLEFQKNIRRHIKLLMYRISGVIKLLSVKHKSDVDRIINNDRTEYEKKLKLLKQAIKNHNGLIKLLGSIKEQDLQDVIDDLQKQREKDILRGFDINKINIKELKNVINKIKNGGTLDSESSKLISIVLFSLYFNHEGAIGLKQGVMDKITDEDAKTFLKDLEPRINNVVAGLPGQASNTNIDNNKAIDIMGALINLYVTEPSEIREKLNEIAGSYSWLAQFGIISQDILERIREGKANDRGWKKLKTAFENCYIPDKDNSNLIILKPKIRKKIIKSFEESKKSIISGTKIQEKEFKKLNLDQPTQEYINEMFETIRRITGSDLNYICGALKNRGENVKEKLKDLLTFLGATLKVGSTEQINEQKREYNFITLPTLFYLYDQITRARENKKILEELNNSFNKLYKNVVALQGTNHKSDKIEIITKRDGKIHIDFENIKKIYEVNNFINRLFKSAAFGPSSK